jgi:hypothetical protein
MVFMKVLLDGMDVLKHLEKMARSRTAMLTRRHDNGVRGNCRAILGLATKTRENPAGIRSGRCSNLLL